MAKQIKLNSEVIVKDIKASLPDLNFYKVFYLLKAAGVNIEFFVEKDE